MSPPLNTYPCITPVDAIIPVLVKVQLVVATLPEPDGLSKNLKQIIKSTSYAEGYKGLALKLY